MSAWVPVLIGVIILVAASQALRRLPVKGKSGSFEKRDLLSPAEAKFFHELRGILDPDALIFVKVRIADLLQHSDFGDFRRIAQKHVNFVLARADTLQVFGVIELDDKSHQLSRRKERDAFVDDSLKSAGIPICHVKVGRTYDLQKLSDQIIRDIYNTGAN
ncbi:MAG: DUF2726 domain-containing protein [Verrucomicrobiales bacterium]|jgi:hypothetical protein|nr:DUF2726 domain-containing protein [Verrucomicrobiales bacterium]